MVADPDPAAVVRALGVAPATIDLILARRDLPPAEPGFYCWWARRGAVAGVPHAPHALDGELGLFYAGISPRRPSSRQNINTRVIGNHVRGNTGSSTFRFVLAALLLDELNLEPFSRGGKVAFEHR